MRRSRILIGALSCAVFALFVAATLVTVMLIRDKEPIPSELLTNSASYTKAQVLDSAGTPLSYTYENALNIHNRVSLHNIPEFLQRAFIEAEDRHFYSHSGVDWWARLHAIVQNLSAGRIVRGASTITEQTVRLIHPRPRTFWSRLLEGLEANELEDTVSKTDILEFYLNQVPYARRRRGVVQASHLYFDRDLKTLNFKEMLALAVLVRAPSRLDPLKSPAKLERQIGQLAIHLSHSQQLSPEQLQQILETNLELKRPDDPTEASHFVQYVLANEKPYSTSGVIPTSLNAQFQSSIQRLLDIRLQALKERNVGDGAVLVVENKTGMVLAWVNAGGYSSQSGSHYDAVTLRRQPGSTLKPFLYALALEAGWTAATLINDAPLEHAVGMGLHEYRNYSGRFYGPLRLREALGNSLNSTAVRTINFVGRAQFLTRLRKSGFTSLQETADYYGNGLALGNAEVTLFEMVQAYRILANNGVYSPLRYVFEQAATPFTQRVFSQENSSIIADILSDPEARRKEFGGGGILNFPIQTAVKTGTSNDYRDAWSIGFSSNYTIGVWMGNLSREPMLGVSGSIGPAIVLRSVFAELERQTRASRLFISPKLLSLPICSVSGNRATENCPQVHEWFNLDNVPEQFCKLYHHEHDAYEATRNSDSSLEIKLPTPGLHLAMDPRIPDSSEVFSFQVTNDPKIAKVHWLLNGEIIGTSYSHQHYWNLQKGEHSLRADIELQGSDTIIKTSKITFQVK